MKTNQTTVKNLYPKVNFCLSLKPEEFAVLKGEAKKRSIPISSLIKLSLFDAGISLTNENAEVADNVK